MKAYVDNPGVPRASLRLYLGVVAFTGVAAVLLVPKLKLGVLGSGQITEVVHSSPRLAELEAEVAYLKTLLAQTHISTGSKLLATTQSKQQLTKVEPSRTTPNELVIDLHRFLGTTNYYGGVSFDAFMCAVPMKTAFPQATDADLEALTQSLSDQVAEAMSRVLGRTVDASHSWLAEFEKPGQVSGEAMNAVIADPRTQLWREELSGVLSRFMVLPNNSWAYQCAGISATPTLDEVGKHVCPGSQPQQIADRIGYHAVPLIPASVIARDVIKWGMCTKSPSQRGSYGQWLKDKRMFTPDWKTFNVPTFEEDAVVFLFDVLYEKLGVFKKQYWLGSIAMQNPFDMFSISDIIYTVKPDLIIETGTANGGSALLWSSLLHLNNIDNGRVVTIDVAEPVWDPTELHWGGVPREDALKHPLWKKHVTFIKGLSTNFEVVKQVRQIAATAKRVLVLLDSDHSAYNVQAELREYCSLVSVDSYCIVEDTKLSRFAHDGPIPAVLSFLKEFDEDFVMDRDRELLYTHHAMGYLKRQAVHKLLVPDTQLSKLFPG